MFPPALIRETAMLEPRPPSPHMATVARPKASAIFSPHLSARGPVHFFSEGMEPDSQAQGLLPDVTWFSAISSASHKADDFDNISVAEELFIISGLWNDFSVDLYRYTGRIVSGIVQVAGKGIPSMSCMFPLIFTISSPHKIKRNYRSGNSPMKNLVSLRLLTGAVISPPLALSKSGNRSGGHTSLSACNTSSRLSKR